MAVGESLAVSLAAAAVRAAFRSWTGSSGSEADIADILIDAGGRQVDRLRRDRASSQAKAFEQFLAIRVEQILEGDLRRMAGNEKEAAVFAAVRTIDDLRPDQRSLAQLNLDPDLLTRELIQTARRIHATRDLSEEAEALTRTLLQESAFYIISISALLPSSNTAAYREILERLGELLRRAEQAINSTPPLLASDGDQERDKEFEETYRRSVASEMGSLRLYGTSLRSAHTRYPISTAYLPLRAEGKERAASARTIEFFCRSPRNLLIVGNAGGGKTTFLQWLAVNCCNRSHDSLIGWLNSRVPLVVRLRQFSSSTLPAPERMVEATVPNIYGIMPKGWAHRLLNSERAIILVDGLDELPIVRREAAIKWIDGLSASYPSIPIVATSRPMSEASASLASSFEVLRIQPLEKSEVLAFCRYWWTATNQSTGDLADRYPSAEDFASGFWQALNKASGIHRLASTPLLLAMLCGLFMESNGSLPRSRVQLYQDTIRTLLQSREAAREVHDQELPAPEAQAILRALARWMTLNFVTRCTEGEALKQIESSHVATKLEASAVLRLLSQRSGLLREPVPGEFDFAHRSFGEFLAAEALVSSGDWGFLKSNIQDPFLAETIVICVSLAGEQVRSEFLAKLLALASAEAGQEKAYITTLIGASLGQTAGGIDPEVRSKCESALQAIIPPRSDEMASALLPAGDLVTSLLLDESRSWSWDSAAIRSTVPLLSEIGSDAALYCLARMAGEVPAAQIDWLMRAWASFDVGQFRDLVLNQLTFAEVVSLTSLEQVRLSESIPGIRKISLELGAGDLTAANDQRVVDLTILDARGLEAIALRSEALRELDLTFAPDLRTVNRCAGLRTMRLERAVKLRRLDLTGWDRIEGVSVDGCGLQSIFTHNGTSSLDYLEIRRCRDFESAESLCDFRALERLVVEDCAVHDLGFLNDLPASIRDLHFSGLDEIDGEPIVAFLPHLRSATLYGDGVNTEWLSGFADSHPGCSFRIGTGGPSVELHVAALFRDRFNLPGNVEIDGRVPVPTVF